MFCLQLGMVGAAAFLSMVCLPSGSKGLSVDTCRTAGPTATSLESRKDAKERDDAMAVALTTTAHLARLGSDSAWPLTSATENNVI